MITIPPECFEKTICIGQIYMFLSSKYDEHPHFLIANINSDEYLAIRGTSQRKTIEKLIKFQNLDPSSVIDITPSNLNSLNKNDTFINCTQYCIVKVNVLKAEFSKGLLVCKGDLSDIQLHNVLVAFSNADNPEIYKAITREMLEFYNSHNFFHN